MTDEEFNFYSAFSYHGYINDLINRDSFTREEALQKAGPNPPTRKGYDVCYSLRYMGLSIGYIWLRFNKEEQEVFGFDFWLKEEFRSKGLGRKTLELLRPLIIQLGVQKIKFFVSKENHVARNLYASLGCIFHDTETYPESLSAMYFVNESESPSLMSEKVAGASQK